MRRGARQKERKTFKNFLVFQRYQLPTLLDSDEKCFGPPVAGSGKIQIPFSHYSISVHGGSWSSARGSRARGTMITERGSILPLPRGCWGPKSCSGHFQYRFPDCPFFVIRFVPGRSVRNLGGDYMLLLH